MARRARGRVRDRARGPDAGVMDRLTAVVLNWRTPEQTVRAVSALLGDGVPEERIVVVDNASGLSRFVPNRLQPALGTHWDHAESRLIHAAKGAVLLVRGTAWAALGGFDERLFMYAEDLDLFRRAASAGWRARFVAEAEFV